MNSLNYYAEGNTDKIIRERYFTDIDYKGVFIEVGAATPDLISMSKHFRENGWRCIHIEPNPKFAQLHRDQGNEVYEYACGEEDLDDVEFTIVTVNSSNDSNVITDHSFSSFSVKDGYKELHKGFYENLPQSIIKVKSRKLDTVIDESNISNIDILSVDTEGWELEVMRGLTKILPKVIVLENLLQSESYNEYMSQLGYNLVEIVDNLNYIYTKL